ncbi:MAG: tetratricopeptide repeat protein [Acidobacteria bacterium]|nr:MAG: tetratricopeptide repeat protein [Acidobacteriota bacterium]REK07927.1 MAG: tetratricopeptide repeat protein [Acidobacteriota bacterium]
MRHSRPIARTTTTRDAHRRDRLGQGVRATLVFCLLALTGAALAAQDWSGRGRIQGVVLDDKGEPVADAKVTLTFRDENGSGPEPLTTNDKGRWSYLGLSSGPWNVVIEAPGFLISEGVAPVNEYQRGKPLETILKPISAAAADAKKMSSDQQAAMAEAAAKAQAQQALLDAGNQALAAEDQATARAKFEQLVAESEAGGTPRTLGLIGLARVAYAEEKVDDAIAQLEKALANQPGNVPALKLISSILVDEGRQAEADVYIAQLPAGEKIDPNALLNQGIEKFNANDIAAALEIFDQVVTDYPNMAEVYYYRGLSNMNAGNNAEALADFRKLLELDPDNENAGEAQQFVDYLASVE